MLDNVTTVGADQYPFYDNEDIPVKKKQQGYGFDVNTSTMYRAVTAAKVAPNKLVTTNSLGRFPFSAIPQIQTAITNRDETVMYRLYVEDDGAVSYDVSVVATMSVTNRAETINYKIYVEDDGALSYDELTGFAVPYVTNRAGNKAYRLYVEDDGALSYDIL